ncbi:MAG: RDD family protein [Actinobacteria bacterium]|nr:RDD family protein [Actinomycetota bacterium]
MTSGRRARWSTAAVAAPAERGAAWLIDTAIFWVVWVAGTILLVETGELGDPPRWTAPRALVWLAVVWVLSRGYDALSVASWGSTAGRAVLGIEVRDRGGGLPTRPAAFTRSMLRTLAVLPLGAGLVPLWTDPQRRGVHDRVAGTVVVRAAAIEVADAAGGLPDPDEPTEPTELAIRGAGTDPTTSGWLRAVAEQTTVRLDVAAPSWRRGEDPAVTAQRAFCLLVAALGVRYPNHRPVLRRVLDRHAALDDVDGDRERYLRSLLDDPDRARAWLGLPDTAGLHLLVDAPVDAGGSRHPAGRDRR